MTKKGKELVNFDCAIITSTARASFVLLSSYGNTISDQSYTYIVRAVFQKGINAISSRIQDMEGSGG